MKDLITDSFLIVTLKLLLCPAILLPHLVFLEQTNLQVHFKKQLLVYSWLIGYSDPAAGHPLNKIQWKSNHYLLHPLSSTNKCILFNYAIFKLQKLIKETSSIFRPKIQQWFNAW